MSQLGIDSLGTENPRPRRGRSCLAVLVAVAIVVAVGVFVYVKGVDFIEGALSGPPDYQGKGSGHVLVAVHKGDSATDIGATLVAAGVVKSQEAFTDAARDDPDSRGIETGYYRLRKHMSAKSALALLLKPESRVSKTVTIPEGKWVSETVAILADKTPLKPADFKAALHDVKDLDLPAYAHGDPEGYLFPATYNVPPGATAEGLLQSMTAKFRAEAKRLHLQEVSQDRHQSPEELVTVASLVQAEASRVKDMPKVARVVYNRLEKGMPLQMDSTLHYAVKKRGTVTTSSKLRKLDSPYNTYTRKGLPPTPIDSPGAKALAAALHPAKGDWLYFVTVNLRTGETKFATTYQQHKKNEAEYHQYCQKSDEC